MSSYDEVPYTSYPYARTHPDRLCTVARLFGMRPAPVERCRVLEIGCASGGNIVPMAELLPDSTFVGFDASGTQVELGKQLAADVGLSNLRLEHANILDVDADWGTFDYIICHGVYSWVDAEVQAKILAIMRELLAPQGVGFLSYNVYPGWHMRESIRHMMRYHVRSIASAPERTASARALIDFLAAHVPRDDAPYTLLLQRELQVLKSAKGDYLFHEHLEEVNEPLYFHQLADRLEQHDLAYLGESDIHTMLLERYAPEAAKALRRVATDLISMEQYMDFVRNRQFRATLVCRRDVELKRNVSSSALQELCVQFAPGSDEGPVDLSPGVAQEFVSAENVRVSSERPLTKAAFSVLRDAWPRPLAFDRLRVEATHLLRESGIELEPTAPDDLAADLLECCFGGAGVRLRSWAPPITVEPGERPSTARCARVQAECGHVATLLHETMHLDRGPSRILQLLDGTRNEDELVEALADLVTTGGLELTRDGNPIVAREEMREPLRAVLRNTLRAFGRRGLLTTS